MLDRIALRLANAEKLRGWQAFFGKIGVIRDDDIRRRLSPGDLAHKSRAAAAFAEHADSAEADWLDLCNSEWLINALAKFDIAAFADVHKFHIHRHARAAMLLLEPELIDEYDLDVAADGVEFLNALVIRSLAAR